MKNNPQKLYKLACVNLDFEKLSKVLQNKVSLFVQSINNILFNNVINLAFLVRNLTIDMKKVDKYVLPEMKSFQKNEIVKFWAIEFIFEILIVIL